MERVNKIAVVVVLVFTLILGFLMLRTNIQRMEESVIEESTPVPVDTLNLSDTVSYYDNGCTFDTLGYRVLVTITYRKDFADVSCRHLENVDDKFNIRVCGLMHAFDSCYADVITTTIKQHQSELASAFDSSRRLPSDIKIYTNLVYNINPQGRAVPKLMVIHKH